MSKSDIILITNSPGELFSWAKVTSENLKQIDKNHRIVIMLVPCPFATGKEEEIARSFPQVDLVIKPWQFLRFSLGFPLKEYQPADKGVVVFLGGDFWHAHLLGRRLKFPVIAYAVKSSSILKHFAHIAVINPEMKSQMEKLGISEDKISVIGNLMLDGVKLRFNPQELRDELGINRSTKVLGILPGSRLYHVQASLPVFLKVAEQVREKIPDSKFLLGLSPFLSLKELEACLLNSNNSSLEGSSGKLARDEKVWKIITEQGVEILLKESLQYDLMNLSDVVLTIPGTNTAELAFLGKPMVVASSWKVKIPRGGFLGLLGNLPLGNSLKKYLGNRILKKNKFMALPNQFAQRAVVPELKVEKGASEITPVVLELLGNPKKQENITRELKGLLGNSGAGEKITRLILKCLENHG